MPFNANRCKVQLKLGLNRLKLTQQKKAGINSQQKREIANLLAIGKEESARIRVEHIIREDFNIEALEILELYCELLLARFGVLEESVHCDQAISEATNTIIFAAHRSGIKELVDVRDQLCMKFGMEFGKSAMLPNNMVNARIVQKLKVQTPDEKLVDLYLLAIAESFNINWKVHDAAAEIIVEKRADNAFTSPHDKWAFEPQLLRQAPLDDQIPTNGPAPVHDAKIYNEPKPMPDFDELNKRFEALKKR